MMQSIIHRMHQNRRRNTHIFLFTFFCFQRSSSLSNDRSGMLLLLLLANANIILFFISFTSTTKFSLRSFTTCSPALALTFRRLNTIANLLVLSSACEDTRKVFNRESGFWFWRRGGFPFSEREVETLGAKGTYIRDAENRNRC